MQHLPHPPFSSLSHCVELFALSIQTHILLLSPFGQKRMFKLIWIGGKGPARGDYFRSQSNWVLVSLAESVRFLPNHLSPKRRRGAKENSHANIYLNGLLSKC